MKRSPIWTAAYVAAWQRYRDAARFVDVPVTGGSAVFVERIPLTANEIAKLCAGEADRCEAGYIAAFGSAEEEAPSFGEE